MIMSLPDQHVFEYKAYVPWPYLDQDQMDWINGINVIESWLKVSVGPRFKTWAWDYSNQTNHIGVAFRWDQDRLLFVITWA